MSTSEGAWSVNSRSSIGGSIKRAREHQSDPTITIFIHDIKEGRQSKYKFTYSLPLKHLLETHCKEANLDYRTVRFTYNGKRLHTTKSAAQLGLEDNDTIEAFVETHGG